MAVPYREWFLFDGQILEGYSVPPDCPPCSFSSIDEWTTEIENRCKIGRYYIDANHRYRYDGLIRPAEKFSLISGADQIVDCQFDFNAIYEEDTTADPNVTIQPYCVDDPNTWIAKFVNGKYYDGINAWGSFPLNTQINWESEAINTNNLPEVISLRSSYYETGIGFDSNIYQDELFRNGILLRLLNYTVSSGEKIIIHITPSYMKIRYLNAIVNSVSRRNFTQSGGQELVLFGLGFNNSDTELDSGYGDAHPGDPWADAVDYIYFTGQQGQGTITLERGLGDFVINSNSQITIPSMPALAQGTYQIQLEKRDALGGTRDIFSQAGEWACFADGRMYQPRGDERFEILADDSYIEKDVRDLGGPIILTKWEFKDGLGNKIFRRYSMGDVQATNNFYDGRIESMGNLRREIDDKTGLFSVSDINFEMANHDREFSKLLYQYFLKNQYVEIFTIFSRMPESWKYDIFTGIVDDYSLQGNKFKISIKDITQKFFKKKLPLYPITSDDYPNCPQDNIGRPMPELIGLNYNVEDPAGACEAILVDPSQNRYLAARASLHSVTEVYSEGISQTIGSGLNCEIVYADAGRTYIDFKKSQGDNKITFNCCGYMFSPWNSVNGYVQNPAYCTAFLLLLLSEIPISMVDMDSIDEMATYFENEGKELDGKIFIQDSQDPMSVLQDCLKSFGLKCYPANDGRLTLGRKTRGNYTTDLLIFDQIDLQDSAEKKWNLREIINYIRATYNCFPAPGMCEGAVDLAREKSITDFESDHEPDWEMNLPFVLSEDYVIQLLNDELLKYSYGKREIHFSIPIQWLSEIDIFQNFRFQDPFGLSSTGVGEQGRYYYLISLSYNFQQETIDCIGMDLQWLLRQCMIIGREADIPRTWAEATEEQRMFAYIGECFTGTFFDGEPNKKICKCDT